MDMVVHLGQGNGSRYVSLQAGKMRKTQLYMILFDHICSNYLLIFIVWHTKRELEFLPCGDIGRNFLFSLSVITIILFLAATAAIYVAMSICLSVSVNEFLM